MYFKTLDDFQQDVVKDIEIDANFDFTSVYNSLKYIVNYLSKNLKYDNYMKLVKYNNTLYSINLNKNTIVKILDDLLVMDLDLFNKEEIVIILNKTSSYAEYIYNNILTNSVDIVSHLESFTDNITLNTIKYLNFISVESIVNYSTKYVYNNYTKFFESRGLIKLKKNEFQEIVKSQFNLIIKYTDVHKVKNKVHYGQNQIRPRVNTWVWRCGINE